MSEPVRTASSDDALVAIITAGLDAAGRQPRYQQIAVALARAIESGALPAGAALPPEPELAERLGVSRQTLNSALTGLARRGLLVRRRRAGTFVAGPVIEQPLGELYSFLRTLQARGLNPKTRLLGYRLTIHPRASPLLAGNPEALVLEVERLRLVDGVPFVLETILLPERLGTALDRERLPTEPLYDLLREQGVAVTHAEETLAPVKLTGREAALLGLPADEPVFRVERTGYAGATPVELRVSLIRGDRFRFRVHLEAGDLEDSIS